MADDTASWKKDAHTELNRKLARRKQADLRGVGSSLAASGGFYSGAKQERERQVGQDIGEMWHQGAQAIEGRAESARQAELGRQHQTSERESSQTWQTGEREGSQLFQTGERIGTQEWQSGENEATRGIQLELQKMADAARFELQELVQTGQMTLQKAEQKWQSYESDLNRQLEWESTSGQWGHETTMQNAGIIAAMDLQNDTQEFENFMAELGREWDIADRDWDTQMWLLDAQLQSTVAGWDWPDGWEPAWLREGVSDDDIKEWGIYGRQNPRDPTPDSYVLDDGQHTDGPDPSGAGYWYNNTYHPPGSWQERYYGNQG